MNKIEEYLQLVQESNFPFDCYSDTDLKKDYVNLKKSTNKVSNIGLKLVRYFHPSIWRCNIKNHKAPIDAWYDEYIMKKVIENRLKYLKTDTLSIYNIRSGLSISRLAPKVSIFRPSLAKYLIQKYLNNYVEIFDPCAGFSGRMLGTCVLNKKYIGQDINSITIREANKLKEFLNLNAELKLKDSIYDKGNYECLFTCPPYTDKECWHQDIEILSTDEWIDICLKNYNCQAYLFVVDKTEKYKDYIVEKITNNSYLSNSEELIIYIKKEI